MSFDQLPIVDELNLDQVAHIVADHIDWTPLMELGFIPVTLRATGYSELGFAFSVIVEYDPETKRTRCRHE
jgi:hypothetical protein